MRLDGFRIALFARRMPRPGAELMGILVPRRTLSLQPALSVRRFFVLMAAAALHYRTGGRPSSLTAR